MSREPSGKCCIINGHPQQGIIERLILTNIPNREIAKRYGLSEATVRRHKNIHMTGCFFKPPAVVDPRDNQIVPKLPAFDDIASWIEYLRERIIRILDVTEQQENYRDALGAARELRGNLELMIKGAELLMAYKSSNDIEKVIQVILEVLAPYQEIKDEVANALRSHGL